MEPGEAALLSSVLHLPAGLTITSVHPSATELVVGLACDTPSMPWEDVSPALDSHPWELSTHGRRFALCGSQRDPDAHRAQIRL